MSTIYLQRSQSALAAIFANAAITVGWFHVIQMRKPKNATFFTVTYMIGAQLPQIGKTN
ncbi:hypothetical protein N9F34_02290 [Alphaproteobacteria bacterium]|nr:hypothetical protein [Alphaproteobacteria bacterium]